MKDVEIRDARRDDAAQLSRLLDELGYPTEPAVLARRLERVASDPSNRVLVAVRDAEVLGLAGLHVLWILNHEGAAGRLMILSVRADCRRTGVGSALVDAVESIARSKGCELIEVTSGAHRADAHAFYERLGYVERPRRFVKRLG